MSVNEAPWFTHRVELIIMISMFLIFFSIDFMRCKQNCPRAPMDAITIWCDGSADSRVCGDEVAPTLPRTSQCAGISYKSSILLVHIVHIDAAGTARAKTSSNHKEYTLPPLIAVELNRRIENVLLTNATKGLFGADVFGEMRKSIGMKTSQADNSSSHIEKLKVVYSYDTVSVKSQSDLLTDIEAALPFRRKELALQRHLPGLNEMYQRLLSKNLLPLKGEDYNSCMKIFLIVVVALTPGSHVSWVEEDPLSGAKVLLNAQMRVSKSIMHYIRMEPQFAPSLDDVWFVNVPIGYPQHGINSAAFTPNGTEKRGGVNVSSQRMVENICVDTERAKACLEGCEAYKGRGFSYLLANIGLQKLAHTAGKDVYAAWHIINLPYKYHFPDFDALRRTNWQDCTSLSAAGMEQMAESITRSLFATPEG